MLVDNRGSVVRLLLWQWRNVLIFIISGTVVATMRIVLEWEWLQLPIVPMSIVGAALGIFVSFRTNSAYDRWWEGRKLWGRMINTSRHFATEVLTLIPSEGGEVSEVQLTLVMRHVAYVHALRVLLRLQDPNKDADLQRTLRDDEKAWTAQSNLTHALLHEQQRTLAALADKGTIGEMRLHSMDLSIAKLLDIQGGCERIKKTPLPRGYGFIAERLILAFGILFPITLAHQLGWVVIPVNVLVCLSFALISEAGRVLEDPFNMFWNGLPLTQISRMIEVNVRERMGDTDLVPIPKPDENGILM
ncbi:MAG: bestrophin family ion channel [Myxococcota bacterium]